MTTMKKLFLSLLAIAACAAMQAAEVNHQQAMEKAKTFVSQQSGGRRAAADIQLKTAETGIRQLYAFNMEGGGYVIVSGSDRTKEVLGYAPQGTLDGDMPAAMRKLLESYAQQITEAEQNNGDADQEDEEQVYAVKYNIEPLIKQRWSQEPPFLFGRDLDRERQRYSGETVLVGKGQTKLLPIEQPQNQQ